VPASFAAQGGRVRYIDDDVVRRRDAIGIEEAFDRPVRRVRRRSAEVRDGHVARFVRALALRVSPDDGVRPPASAVHVERVLGALEELC
jgi:hypothetical protein